MPDDRYNEDGTPKGLRSGILPTLQPNFQAAWHPNLNFWTQPQGLSRPPMFNIPWLMNMFAPQTQPPITQPPITQPPPGGPWFPPPVVGPPSRPPPLPTDPTTPPVVTGGGGGLLGGGGWGGGWSTFDN